VKGVHLGYEVGAGVAVEIPLRHMVVTGQTQEAGKTTTLEAMIVRAKVKAIAFVTKRGEGSFSDARVVPPYFKEQADWKYVASILEASRGEKMKFERSWIIRASKGATSLADVHKNVRKALETAKGIHADVYLTLDAYLDDVVPLIDQVQWAKRIDLSPGLNVMDLTALNVEMQHLVIRSTIEWVLKYETNTVVVVPEAWKFIPQGRGTPVKLAAEAYIRQAAGLGNYLWLDSQDIAGVEKIILKSVPIWILGVQRESNEIKRTLANIPAGIKKPKADEIATLKIGQFYACYGEHVIKTYVQPIWLSNADAKRVAVGALSAPASPTPPTSHETKEASVNETKARQLREANQRLEHENAELRRRLDALERSEPTRATRAAAVMPASTASGAVRSVEYQKPKPPAPVPGPIGPTGNGSAATGADDALYYAIRDRLLAEDPAPLLRLLVARPEIEVAVERKTVTLDGTTVKGRVAKLLAEGFFASGQRPGSVRSELQRTGKDVNPNTLQSVLVELVVDGFLTNEGSGRYKLADGAIARVVDA
jgi:hypothetical protein